MEAVFLKLVNMSITAGWLVLAILALRLVFRNVPKWILCLLWGLVAVRLIFPFSFESVLSLIPSPEPLPPEIIHTARPALQSGIVIIDNAANPLLESSMTPMEPASANPTQIWSFLLSRVWLLGMAAMGAYTLISYWVLHRRVATAIPVEKGIKQCEFIDSPFVLGIFRPVIYLPRGMAEADLAYVIAHERAHIRRRDHWWKPLGFLLLSIYWFNPVLWLAYILLCRDIEAACDEKVIRDMTREDRRAYSTALLNCSIHRRSIAACPLAFGETGVKARVTRVMHYKKPAFWVILGALVLGVILAACFLTDPAGIHLYEIDDSRNYADLLTNTENITLTVEGEDYPVRDTEGLLQALETVTVREFTLRRSRSETRDKTNRIRLREHLYLNFSWDCSSVWIDNGVKPTYSYRVIHTNTVRKIFDSIYGVNLKIEAFQVTSTGLSLRHMPADGWDRANTITDGFRWLEVKTEEGWQVYPSLSGVDHATVGTVITENRDIHTLNWKASYGTLPTGTYRVCQDCYFIDVDQKHTLYSEFTVTQQLPCIFAEAAGSGGMILALEPAEAFPDVNTLRAGDFRLEYWDGRDWLPQSAAEQEGDPIRLTASGNGRCRLDWSGGYGRLENGIYRLVMDCRLPETGEECLYAEFGVDEAAQAENPVTEIRIFNRKLVSTGRPETVEALLTALRSLEGQVEPAPAELLAQARADSFYTNRITLFYGPEERELCFSRDYSLVWEEENTGWLVKDPESIKSYVNQLTDGVLRGTTSGEPFADASQPAAWCTGITPDAIETAQVYVEYRAQWDENTVRQSSSNGPISRSELAALLAQLNRLPEDAFRKSGTTRDSFHGLLVDFPGQEGISVYLTDRVNGLTAVLRCSGDVLELILTEEQDKVEDRDLYLEPTPVWALEAPELHSYMTAMIADPPVITYTVGAEYSWQPPVSVTAGDRTVELRFIEGWEYEFVDKKDRTGIRCRPAGERSGWLEFSFWPKGYSPREQDRYLQEGSNGTWPIITSWPAEVSTPASFDTRDFIWSYMSLQTDQGDYAIILDGDADWFAEQKDAISDTVTLSSFHYS